MGSDCVSYQVVVAKFFINIVLEEEIASLLAVPGSGCLFRRGLPSVIVCDMSMAVVCVQLSLFCRSIGAPKTKNYSNCNVASPSGGLIFRPHQNCGGRRGYVSLDCQASSGGSRRDYEKILARKQKRRVRHMKGVTPSTPDLIKTLDLEKRDQAKLDSYPDAVSDKKEHDHEVEVDSTDDGIPRPLDEAAMLSPNMTKAAYVDGVHVASGSEDNKGSADLTEETQGAVADTAGVQEDPTADRVQKSSK